MDPVTAVATRLRAAGCVFAEDEAALLIEAAAADEARLEELVISRVAGHPLEHLLGWAAFAGRRILVGPGVFVPRRRTELLAALAVRWATRLDHPVVIDQCCGTGAVAVVVASAVPGAQVHATDLDPAAVRDARRNLGPRGWVWRGDLFAALPERLRGTADVITANAPYVPTDQIRLMPTEARDFEGRAALDGGPDGLDLQRRVIAEAPAWLADTGLLLVETSRAQAPATLALFLAAGFDAHVETDDEIAATVVVGALGRGGQDRSDQERVPR